MSLFEKSWEEIEEDRRRKGVSIKLQVNTLYKLRALIPSPPQAFLGLLHEVPPDFFRVACKLCRQFLLLLQLFLLGIYGSYGGQDCGLHVVGGERLGEVDGL